MAFILRHLIAVPALALLLGLLWVVVYGMLLFIAAFTGSPMGAILALPGWFVFIILITLILGWGVFAPACGFGLLMCRLLCWPRLCAIPFVWASGCLLGYALYSLFITFVTTHSQSPLPSGVMKAALYLSLPLGLYWWLTEGLLALANMVGRLLSRRTP